MEIKVCGPGCAKCEEAERLVKEAVAEVGVVATIEKVTDFQQMAGFGIFSTPAVVIGGVVRCVGRVPKKNEIIAWLQG